MSATDVVLAAFDRLTFDQIDWTIQQILELVLHLYQIKQCDSRRVLEFNEHVHVAIGPEIVAGRRAENRQSLDLATSAEVSNPLLRQFQIRANHGFESGLKLPARAKVYPVFTLVQKRDRRINPAAKSEGPAGAPQFGAGTRLEPRTSVLC